MTESTLCPPAVEVSEELKLLRRQGKGLLKQALKCSKHADVRFELDDGSRLVGAHRAPLCCASPSFKGMFSCGMKEEEQGLVRMRGVGASAVKALLEFVYLGRKHHRTTTNLCHCIHALRSPPRHKHFSH